MPILDYSGFLLLVCNKDDGLDLQRLLNDILCICNRSLSEIKVPFEVLHSKFTLLSLEQRMQKQLL